MSLNRSLLANKVRDYSRHGRVEAGHVEHAAIVRVGAGEAVGGHAHNNRLRVADELTVILTQCLCRMNLARRRLAVRVGNKSDTSSLCSRAQIIGRVRSDTGVLTTES